MHPIIFFNIDWMKEYRGETAEKGIASTKEQALRVLKYILQNVQKPMPLQHFSKSF